MTNLEKLIGSTFIEQKYIEIIKFFNYINCKGSLNGFFLKCKKCKNVKQLSGDIDKPFKYFSGFPQFEDLGSCNMCSTHYEDVVFAIYDNTIVYLILHRQFKTTLRTYELCNMYNIKLFSTKKNTAAEITDNLSKENAINLCLKNEIQLGENITFSSSNKATGKFWANPDVGFLNDDWWFLLNDRDKKQIHILFIPSCSINEGEIVVRTDKPYKVDLQINNEKGFEDSRSKIKFEDYLIKTLKY